MGYTSDITNRIDGKKYLISTAQDKKGGGWQTAVLKRRLFGIPDLFHPAVFISALDEEYARRVHARVEEIVAELPPTKWESAKWELFREILEKAFPEPGASAQTVVPNSEGADWSVFHGVRNNDEVLLKKAGVIARLIEIHWDQGIDLASEFKKNPEYPKIRLGQHQMRRVRAETAVVFLRMIDEIAFGVLETEQRDKLMEGLKICVAQMLDSIGVPDSERSDFLCTRYAEYARLRAWADSFERGGLLREYAKKIGAIVNIERDALFHTMLTNLLLRSLERWELKELLSGVEECE